MMQSVSGGLLLVGYVSDRKMNPQMNAVDNRKPTGQLSRLSNMQMAAGTSGLTLGEPAGSSCNSTIDPQHLSVSQPQTTSSSSVQRSSIIVSKIPVATDGTGHAASIAASTALSNPKVPMPCTHNTKSWKLQYSFCTPVEKKLQQQLEAIRKDPEVRKALEARLEAYKAADAPLKEARDALLECNKQQVITLTHDVRLQQVQQGARQRDERMQQAQQQHREREEALLAAKAAAAHRGAHIRHQRLEHEAERETERGHVWRTKQWSGVVYSGNYVTQLLVAMQQLKQATVLGRQQQAAVITIQKYWRRHRAQKQYRRARHAVCLLQQAWRRYQAKTAQQDTRCYKAAVCCLCFLMELNGSSGCQLRRAAKRVKHTVLRDVRLSKQLDLKHTSQFLLLTQQWVALELKMIAFARRRAGADVIIQSPNTQLSKQSKLAKLTKHRPSLKSLGAKGTTGASNRATASDGPAPSSCHANDRLLLEDLQPTHLELKGKIADMYLRMKTKAFVAVLGLYWRDKAGWKRTHREHRNLAAARTILHGSAEQHRGSQAGISADLPNPPGRPKFRATATLKELAVLMQQSVAETPYFDAANTRKNIDNYRAQLLQDQTTQKQPATATEADSRMTSPISSWSGGAGGWPAEQVAAEQQQLSGGASRTVSDRIQA